ncbi:coat protein [Army ant associated cyclovirus 6]|nr:coat protein [Army ant associated cyclovirus 6]
MARYRRTFRRRRRPLQRRRRRIFRRRRIHRPLTGTLYAKFTKTVVVKCSLPTTTTWGGPVTLGEFVEFNELIRQFEYFRPMRIRVRVLPLQNVSNNSTSSVPMYCIFPWHRPISITDDFGKFLSIDKAKIRRQTSPVTMNFVPSIYTAALATENSIYTNDIVYRPKIARSFGDMKYPVLYWGGLAFQGITGMTGESNFNIVMDLYVRMYNQSTAL